MKNGNWIPVDKNIINLKEKSVPYTKIEAYISLRIDLDNNTQKGLREYARIWNWSRKKVELFFKLIRYKTGKSKETIKRQSRDNRETGYRLIIIDLEKQKRQKGDNQETLERHNYNTNTNINIKDIRKNNKFIPPTLEELELYIEEKNYSFDPELFINFYESKGWMIGKNKMKSWKAACVTWQKNKKDVFDINEKDENGWSIHTSF